jgi:hypothetical protein
MEHTLTYLVVAEDATSHEHHHRLRRGETISDVLRAAVGGWLAHVGVADPRIAVWCDEDGYPTRRRVNPAGSRLIALLGGPATAFVGPIVITGHRRHSVVSLTTSQVERLVELLTHCR